MTSSQSTGHPHPNPLPSRDREDLPGALSGLRVLELSGHEGDFCGKLMADMGADVIKIEPPGGESSRSRGPFYNDTPDRNGSLWFWHYNTSKRGVTLNLETADGQAMLKQLVRSTDILLESHRPGYLPGLGLGYNELSDLNPGLIMCSLTPFGQSGPWRDFKPSDLIHMAGGGQMASCGYDDADVAGGPPMAPGGGQSWHIGGEYAYIAIVSAVMARTMTGRGTYIDSSIHDACALTTEGAVNTYIYSGKVVYRHTGRHATVDFIDVSRRGGMEMPTRDGRWVHLALGELIETPARLRRLAEWMDEHRMAQDLLDETYETNEGVQANKEHVWQTVREFLQTRDQDEIWHKGQSMGFPWGAVRSMDEVTVCPHLDARGFFTEVDHPEHGRSFTYPGPAAIFNGSPWRISRRAPLVGEHNEEILCGYLGLSRQELALLAESGVV